jgi:hypothetical protein
MMRRFLLGSIALMPLVIAACSKPLSKDEQPSAPQNAVAESAADLAAPAIAPSSAPGVAFNYQYAFRLPNAKIAAVQEEHAQLCEKLGLDRCRITGMRYKLVSNDEVSAMLAFKLDPAIARDFGKQGIAAVTKSDGMLVDSEISGIDAGAEITGSQRASAALRDELAKVEAQLARVGLPASERAELQEQAADLRAQLRRQSETRTAARDSIATTPMVFNYGSGDVIPGFDGASPVREALRNAVATFGWMFGLIIVAAGALLPWGMLGGLGWWFFRRFRAKPAVPQSA